MIASSQPLRLIALDDAEAVARHVAHALIAAALEPLPGALGLATGTTMVPVYAALVAEASRLPATRQQRLRRHWLSFNLDEYVGLPAEHPGSFATFMRQRLAAPLGLDPARLQLPDGQAADPQAEAKRYGAAIGQAGGIALQLLGLGLNGHVGFNEPPCSATASCRSVLLSAETRRHNAPAFGGDPAAVPQRAITLGLAEILAARRILLVVTGAAKAPVLRRLLLEPPSPQLPASWLQGHPATAVIADRAALSACGELP